MQNSRVVSSQSSMMPWQRLVPNLSFYACNVSCHDQNCKNPREVNLFLAKYLALRPQLFTFFSSLVILIHDKRRVVRRETGRIIKTSERDFCVMAITYLFIVYFSFSVYSVFLIFLGKNHGHSYL